MKARSVSLIILIMIFANPFCVNVMASSEFHPDLTEGEVLIEEKTDSNVMDKCEGEEQIAIENDQKSEEPNNILACCNEYTDHHVIKAINENKKYDSDLSSAAIVVPDYSFQLNLNNFSNIIFQALYLSPPEFGILEGVKKIE